MNRIFYILVFSILILNTFLYAKHYCIQITAVPVNDVQTLKNDKNLVNFVSDNGNCILDKRLNGKYYAVCCGDYHSYKSTFKDLYKIRKFYPKAFPRAFNPEKSYKINIKKIKPVKKVKKVIQPKQPNKVKPKIIAKPKIPLISENFFDNYVERNIDNAKLTARYNTFTLKSFLVKYLENNNNFKIKRLLSELYAINPALENDKYNPNIYFNIGTSARKTYNVGTATNKASLDALASLNLDWHLYDAQKKYFNNERRVIFKRLSELNLLASRDQTILNGLSVYLNLWYLQKIIDKYNFLLSQQEKLTKMIIERTKKGENKSVYEAIDSKNDLFTLKIAISDIKESYVNQEHLFRQSLNLTSPKPIYLYDPVYTELDLSLKELYKEAIANNKELARLQEEYKLSKSDLLIEAARKGWNIDFYSYVGYGGSTELEGSNTDSGNGFEWQVGLRATYPISQRKDITYQVQRRKVLTKQAKLRIDEKIKTLLISVNKIYNSIKKLKYKENIYLMKEKILKQRLNISYNRFLKGESFYKDYSDALRLFTDNLRNRLLNEVLLHESVLQLYILTGRTLF